MNKINPFYFLLSPAKGWSVDCLQEWGPFLKLAIPSMLMICLEWWLYEIASFLAGVISEVELGAQSVVYELSSIAYMVTTFHCSFVVIRKARRSEKTHCVLI